ncbi:L,D-transpeptidase family protein [Sphingomonas sp.]|uniref:L,D-transpeptidase family protein n=1 Tax=Sphingomonas sp. TaxID=28214 RepID=UPI0025E9E93B|nr:L,D-transpeptidase family protein [Sphingomonas sp.]MBV9528629.1 L,D-transpeptidase family protein [Sphingomonas sp.]
MLVSCALTVSSCHKAPAAPVTVQSIDRAGDRIEFATPQPLKVPGVGDVHHDVKSLLNVTTPLGYGEYVWNTDGIPKGPTWVLVDLGAQTMSVFRSGHEIGTAVLLFGMDSKPSPVGDLKILEKNKDYWSHTYDAAMPYALRLTNDGVAIHGSEVELGSATHGCLGVPVDFARRLFSVMNVGDEVMILPASRGHKA